MQSFSPKARHRSNPYIHSERGLGVRLRNALQRHELGRRRMGHHLGVRFGGENLNSKFLFCLQIPICSYTTDAWPHRLNYLSSPNITFRGTPTGRVDRDSRRAHIERMVTPPRTQTQVYRDRLYSALQVW